MPDVPFQLRYMLSRAQRLVPHVRLWGVLTTIFVLALFAFFCVRTAVAAWSLEWAVWTLQHFNGSVLHVPVSAITQEQLSHFEMAMERGRGPEGVRAVVESGQKIAELRRTGGEA